MRKFTGTATAFMIPSQSFLALPADASSTDLAGSLKRCLETQRKVLLSLPHVRLMPARTGGR